MGFHRVIGDALVIPDKCLPFCNEISIFRGVDGHEVVPRRQVTNQRSGIQTRQFFFPYRESDDRNVFSLDALVRQFLIERHIGIPVDGRDHSGFLTGRPEGFDVRHNGLPVRMTKWGIVDHDVFRGHAFIQQIGLQDFVRGAGIDIVRSSQNPTLYAFRIGQVIHRRNGLLVRGRAGIEYIALAFFAFILNRIEQNAVQFFKDRQD